MSVEGGGPQDKTLAEEVVGVARSKEVTLALAESCTGGMIAAELTSVPGASAVFFGSAVTYADAAKVRMLGVSERTLAAFGAVSKETAAEMALGAHERMGADLALAVTGIAGPDGGTDERPVGTVWFAIATERGAKTLHRLFAGDRRAVREQATATGLELIHQELLTDSPSSR